MGGLSPSGIITCWLPPFVLPWLYAPPLTLTRLLYMTYPDTPTIRREMNPMNINQVLKELESSPIPTPAAATTSSLSVVAAGGVALLVVVGGVLVGVVAPGTGTSMVVVLLLGVVSSVTESVAGGVVSSVTGGVVSLLGVTGGVAV